MPINATQKITLKLVVAAIGMFVFAVFLMPPLYDVFCELTGIGGKTKGQYEGTVAAIDAEREVKVQFVATNNGAMPWEFAPVEYQVRVRFMHVTRRRGIWLLRQYPISHPTMQQNFFTKLNVFALTSSH